MIAVGKKVIKSVDVSVRQLLPRSRTAVVAQELGGVVNKRVLEAKARAEAILAEAEAEAARVRSQAQQLLGEVEATHAQAKADGFAQGREEGLASVTELLATLERQREAFFAQAESEIVKLVLQCTEKAFGRITEEHRAIVVEVIRQAIAASIGDRMVISVSPQDFATVTKAEGELRAVVDRTKRIHFKEDEAVSPGGCVLETEIGTIDARLETQLKAIRKAFDL